MTLRDIFSYLPVGIVQVMELDPYIIPRIDRPIPIAITDNFKVQLNQAINSITWSATQAGHEFYAHVASGEFDEALDYLIHGKPGIYAQIRNKKNIIVVDDEFYKVRKLSISSEGHKVIATHILKGVNFEEVEDADLYFKVRANDFLDEKFVLDEANKMENEKKENEKKAKTSKKTKKKQEKAQEINVDDVLDDLFKKQIN